VASTVRARHRRFAIREGIWSADQEAAALNEIQSAIEAAQRQVEELPRPGAAAIFEHVYETLPPRLQEQRAEALDDARPS
jgi:TPP-dependent pyruvate/acetoin dehydrogenase alpha subunit